VLTIATTCGIQPRDDFPRVPAGTSMPYQPDRSNSFNPASAQRRNVGMMTQRLLMLTASAALY
jgi:hypothetical protein